MIAKELISVIGHMRSAVLLVNDSKDELCYMSMNIEHRRVIDTKLQIAIDEILSVTNLLSESEVE